jgi:hypothetical protein
MDCIKDNFSLYAILDPRKPGIFHYNDCEYTFEYEPFYIGRGSGSCYKRKYRHLSEKMYEKEGNNLIKINKIKSIRKDGYEPIFIVIHSNLSLEKSCELESRYIKTIGKYIEGTGCLTNVSDGGEFGRIGAIMSEEQKTKISETMKNKEHYLRGKKMTESMRLKLRESHLGFKASEQTKKLLSKMRKGKTIPNSRKKYVITSPNGEEVIVDGVTEFCKQNNINTGDFYRCKSGKIKQTKGWKNIRKL